VHAARLPLSALQNSCPFAGPVAGFVQDGYAQVVAV
jgi:hypothetical protein